MRLPAPDPACPERRVTVREGWPELMAGTLSLVSSQSFETFRAEQQAGCLRL